MAKKKLLFPFVFCCFFSFGQQKESKRFDWAFSPGVIVQRNVFLDANVLIGKTFFNLNPKVSYVGIKGIRIGLETDCHRTFAPKIGYEFTPMLFTLRLSAANYFQNDHSEFRVIPEMGLSFYGWINLTYGYGIALNNSTITDIGHHRVALTFNFNKKVNKKYLDSLLKNQAAQNSGTHVD